MSKYFSLTDRDRKEMLKFLGIESIEELLKGIPEEARLKKLINLPGGNSEEEVKKIMAALANKNKILEGSPSGANSANSFSQKEYVPAVIDYIINGSPELITSYTPYQAEIAQGPLEILFDFQSMICELTGCDIANASMYDGASAAAEAVLMALRCAKKKTNIVISSGLWELYTETIKTYLSGLNIEIKIAHTNEIAQKIDEKTACLVVCQPNTDKKIEDIASLANIIHEKQGLLVVVANPLFLALLETPGKLGADIVCGESQPWGNYVSFGGPYLGFFAAKKEFYHDMPGRIVIETTTDGKRSYILGLQAREQHIKREKATSNICSNQSLLAIRAAIYLSYMGKKGLAEIARKYLTEYIEEKYLEPCGKNVLPRYLRKTSLNIPAMNELELIRHYLKLTRKTFGVDSGPYLLGSCTMKLTPKIIEWAALLPGFTEIHPNQPEHEIQGALELMHKLEKALCEICGMKAFTLQPSAGAQGEFVGLLIIRAYHKSRQEDNRKKVIIPDSAHGTNPASATLAGYKSVTVKSNSKGMVDLEDLKRLMGNDVAAVMLTNPNTLGIFESQILEITRIAHEAGALVYMDGANLNALLGISRPGDFGIDVLHVNLHKTFGTPHGSGGPGSGPVGVCQKLAPFLPVPTVETYRNPEAIYYFKKNKPNSIGKTQAFYGAFNVMVKAYAYILYLGADGLKQVSEDALLTANYLKKKLTGHPDIEIPYNENTLHEFVLSLAKLEKETGVTAKDVCKRMLDFGVHPPTMYFPLIVPEDLMIEPTESITKTELDEFADTLIQILYEARNLPELLKNAPQNLSVKRINDVTANRQLKVRKLMIGKNGIKMFLCPECHRKYECGDKEFFPKQGISYGPCENCGKTALCIDCHSYGNPKSKSEK